ncbi:hypothetical protein C2W62_07625 [Candidatus Entotheonella serta]|nr:hypothetical protein C2W62_07625 [Candidatus Entotheonella serta]
MSREYRSLATFVKRTQRGLDIRRCLQAGVVLLVVALLVVLTGIGVYQLVPSVPLLAPIYSGFAVIVLGFVMFWVVVPALRPRLKRETLSNIAEAYPDLKDDLTNALELDPDQLERSNPRGVALELVRALHRQTALKMQAYTPRAVVKRYRLQGLLWCGLLLCTAGLVTVLHPPILQQSLHVMVSPVSYLPARDLKLTVTPEHATIARGTNLEVHAQVTDEVTRRVEMQILLQRPGQPEKRYAMERVSPGRFRYVFLKPQDSFSFQAMSEGFRSPSGQVDVVPAPAVGNLTLHYLFPDYTGLSERTQSGGGDIQALPGTQVRLSMQANVPLNQATLRFAKGDELPLAITDRALQGEILIMEEGAYRIEIEDRHGLSNQAPPWYTIQVTPDAIPTVKWLRPEDGMEVDETTVLDIGYEAEDDFGLQDAALVYQGSDGVEHRLPLQQGRFDQRRVTEQFSWDLYQRPLPAGDTVQVYIEVYDKDTISGPKKGVSETLTLKVRDREEEHQALEDLQREIADALLDLLADHLELADDFESWRDQEAPVPEDVIRAQAKQQQAAERAEQLSEQLEEALAKVQNDPYSTYETYADLQALQRNMDYLQQELMPQLAQSMQPMQTPSPSDAQREQADEALEDVVEELERLSSLAEDIANAEKFHDLMQLSTKMMEQQNQLLAALDNMPQDFQGGDIPPELQKLLDSIDQMMQELASAISQMPQNMSDEFLNQQLENLPLNNMQQQLDEIRKKLAEGDVEGAKKLAEELLKTLSTMVASMQNMEQQARGGPMDAMSQQLQESVDTLSDLVQRQEEIVDETQRLDQEALEQLNRAQQEAFEAMQRDLERELAELAQQMAALARRARQNSELDTSFQRAYRDVQKRLGQMRQHLQNHDMPQSRDALDGAQRQMDWMQQRIEQLLSQDQQLEQQAAQAQESLSSLRQRMEGLPRDRQAMLSPEQRGQLGQLGQRQGAVGNETAQLQQTFDNLLPLMPFLPNETANNLRQAVPLMQQAQGELNTHQSQQAISPEQGALEHLRNAQNSMQQAMQQLSQRGQMIGQSMPMLRQAGRLPMPDQRPRVDQRENGIAGASVRNFQLPDKEAYKVPRMFREDIMEALKEGYPERYKELIEQYYRNIVR